MPILMKFNGLISHKQASGCQNFRVSVKQAACTARITFEQRCQRRGCITRAEAVKDTDKALVVVGSVNADMVLQVDRLPKEGETLAASNLQTFPGGKGANQAAAAGKLGYNTIMLGQVGEDANAELLRSSLQDAGVDLQHLRTVKGPSGSAVILLQPSGENSIIVVGGANVSDWEITTEYRQVLKSAGSILLQREIPESVNAEAAKIASETGVTVVMDCGGVEDPISAELLKKVSVLSPNETELARLTGMPTESKEEVEAAARVLLDQGVKNAVLVKRGKNGSLLVTRESAIEQGIFEAGKVVDTTGAGDCFTGAFAVATLEGLKGGDALQFAAAAASICVQREGAMTSLPTRQEVEQILKDL